MAQCKQSAVEFIQNTFSPHVAVVCSTDAELLCQKNNLTFVQLLQPFCRLQQEVHIRDPNHGNTACTIQNLRITVCDMHAQPPQQAAVRKMLNDAVSSVQQTVDGGRGNVISVGHYDLQLNASTSWFEAYRECFLSTMPQSDHEYLSNCLACIFAVSSSNPDPLETFATLAAQQLQQQQQFPNKPPRWFCAGILHYFVLLHDVVEGEQSRAESMYQSMKTKFGAGHCHLLLMNSRSLATVETLKSDLSLPDPWSQFLPKPLEPAQEGVEYDGPPLREEEVGGGFPSQVEETPASPRSPMSDSVSSLTGSITGSINSAVEELEEGPPPPQNFGQSEPQSTLIDHPLAFSESDNSGGDRDQLTPDGDPTAAANGYQDSGGLGGLGGRTDKGSKSPRGHGLCLTTSDQDRLRIFMHEFVVRALVPWAEKQMRTFTEQLMSRKGIHRSLFSATKKWFGNKSSSPIQSNQNTTVVYTSEAPELQLRRLGDLAFLFQMYEFAYTTYHTAKRDFNNDYAWLHYAGALEMASISIYMQGTQSQRSYPDHYMDSAISTYLQTCRNMNYATRATFISTEILKSKGMYQEAARQFLKMTTEESDLSSALFLEQAAHCFINMKMPQVRKFAFHMILTGHRFIKSGQRKHALRAYSQALQVYKSKHWTLAEDHIHFTIGRQSFNLKQLENATSSFKHLLTADSKQPASQQAAFLREYLFVYKQLLSQEAGESSSYGRLPELPLPNVVSNETKVLLGHQPTRERASQVVGRKVPATGVWFTDDESTNTQWAQLEERLVASGNGGTPPLTFKPSLQCFTKTTDNRNSPVAFVGEPITVEVTVENPLRISLVLSDVTLLWSFLPSITGTDKPQLITNEITTGVKNNLADEIIQTAVIREVVLEGTDRTPVHLRLVPRQPGELRVVGLAYNLGTTPVLPQAGPLPPQGPEPPRPSFASALSVRGKQRLEVQGPRLNGTKQERTSMMYGPDRRLDLIVQEEMPILQVNLVDFPESLLCGEVHCIEVEFSNAGRSPLSGLAVASTHPHFFTFGHGPHLPRYPYVYQPRAGPLSGEADRCPIRDLQDVVPITLPGGSLKPGESVSLPLWLRGNDIGGVHEVDFLFYYEPVSHTSKIRHRVLRHRAVVRTVESLTVRAHATKPSARVNRGPASQPNTCLINCELENLSQVQAQRPHIQELQITQVCCVSPSWTLSCLSSSLQRGVRIGSRETLQLVLKGHQQDNQQEKTLLFSEVPFDVQQINSVMTPCSDFYFRSKSQVKGKGPDPIQSPDNGNLNQALGIGLTLVFLWKAFVAQENGQMKILVGQHHVNLEAVNTTVTSYPMIAAPSVERPLQFVRDTETVEPSQPPPEVTTRLVSYCLIHPSKLSHPFHSGLCVVPITVQLKNQAGVDVDVLVDTSKSIDRLNPAGSGDVGTMPSQYNHHPYLPLSSTFTWVGRTLASVSLAPGHSQQLTLKAGFGAPGVYNLNNLAVFVKYSQSQATMILQKQPSPSIITLTADQPALGS